MGQLEQTVQTEKRDLRRQARERRLAMSDAESSTQSAAIDARLQALLDGKCALFWPMLERREVDLRATCEHFWSMSQQVGLPYMDARTTVAFGEEGFRDTGQRSDLVRGKYTFMQPAARLAESQDLAWIVVPALLVTHRGERLGYGAGFYDRMLLRYPKARSVVVAYEHEVVDSLPTEPHDQRADWVVTPSQLIIPSR